MSIYFYFLIYVFVYVFSLVMRLNSHSRSVYEMSVLCISRWNKTEKRKMPKDLAWIWSTKQKCFGIFLRPNPNALTWTETNALNDNRFVCSSSRCVHTLTLTFTHRMIFEVHFSILDVATFFLFFYKKAPWIILLYGFVPCHKVTHK